MRGPRSDKDRTMLFDESLEGRRRMSSGAAIVPRLEERSLNGTMVIAIIPLRGSYGAGYEHGPEYRLTALGL
jgi:hypothetical protein